MISSRMISSRTASVPRFALSLALLSALTGGPAASPCVAQAPAPSYAHARTLTGLLHWSHMPVRVFVATHSPEEEQNGRDALAGFDEWVHASGGLLRYQVVNAPDKADLTVRFTPTATVPGGNGAVGLTDIRYTGLTLRHADMRLATDDTLPNELRSVAAHEFGHALGIQGHSDDPADMMFPAAPRYYSALHEHLPSPVRPVTARDLNTIKLCYPLLFGPTE